MGLSKKLIRFRSNVIEPLNIWKSIITGRITGWGKVRFLILEGEGVFALPNSVELGGSSHTPRKSEA
jgi:hypothetical protein